MPPKLHARQARETKQRGDGGSSLSAAAVAAPAANGERADGREPARSAEGGNESDPPRHRDAKTSSSIQHIPSRQIRPLEDERHQHIQEQQHTAAPNAGGLEMEPAAEPPPESVLVIAEGVPQSSGSPRPMPNPEVALLTRSLSKKIVDKDWDGISLEMLTRESCSKVSSNGWPQLHQAVHKQAKFQIIQRMVKVFPEACAMRSPEGLLPLPLAIMSRPCASSQTLKVLLDANPKACADRIPTQDPDTGYFPLHLALRYKIDSQIVQQMIDAHRDAVEVKSPNGLLPLHLAIQMRAEEQLIRKLIEEYPKACRQHELGGSQRLPLHLALGHMSSGVVTALLDADQMACQEQDQALGWLPLHTALATQVTDDDLIKKIVDLYPDACRKEDDDGKLPIHLAYNASAATCRLLLDTFPEAYRYKSKTGGMPLLHSAILHEAPSVFLAAVLEKCPEASFMTAKPRGETEDLLPLEVAVRYQRPLSMIKTLVEGVGHGTGRRSVTGCGAAGLEAQIPGDPGGRKYRTIVECSKDPQVRLWANTATARTVLKRYTLDRGPCVYESPRSKVVYATDEIVDHRLSLGAILKTGGQRVCLKWMREQRGFETEVISRGHLADDSVIQLIGWHTPESFKPSPAFPRYDERAQEEHTHTRDVYPFVLVLARGERSLYEACAKERLAGYDLTRIVGIFVDAVTCVQKLHAANVMHGDLKQRNILCICDDTVDDDAVQETPTSVESPEIFTPRQSFIRDRRNRNGLLRTAIGPTIDDDDIGPTIDDDDRWLLCDMAESLEVGNSIDPRSLSLSAYSPPEFVRANLCGQTTLVPRTSSDVWSLGVILFELCAGRTLFAQDTSNDELIEESDQDRLCTWDTISDDGLLPVLSKMDVGKLDPHQCKCVVSHAKSLIRWCLKGAHDERPTIDQILDHPLLSFDRICTSCDKMPMKYHAFISHQQAHASGIAATLYHEYRQLGLHCWLDVRQEDLTLQGMRAGIVNSRIFLLVLTEGVLKSWYVQQEILHAMQHGKKIQLIIERDSKFHPFDKKQDLVAGDDQLASIHETIRTHLGDAVEFRRRDVEVHAMMRELCARNGVILPDAPLEWPDEAPVARVFVICNSGTASRVLKDVKDGITAESIKHKVQFVADHDSANCVLVLLTEGILERDSEPLDLLQRTIRHDTQTRLDRTIFLYSKRDGWDFAEMEKRGAPEDVKICIQDHEAIPYRPKEVKHECAVMIKQLFTKFAIATKRCQISVEQEQQEYDLEPEPEPGS